MKYKKRQSDQIDGPGPGSYNIENSDNVKTFGGTGNSPSRSKFSFPRQSRNGKELNDGGVPDPTTYSPKPINRNIAISLAQKLSYDA